MHRMIQPTAVFYLQRVQTRIQLRLSKVSHPGCRSEKSPFHMDSSSQHSRSAALLSLAGIRQTDYDDARNKERRRRLCSLECSPPSAEPCNQRAPGGLVTSSLSRSSGAGRAATSIISGVRGRGGQIPPLPSSPAPMSE